jgi:BTB/POZ domain
MTKRIGAATHDCKVLTSHRTHPCSSAHTHALFVQVGGTCFPVHSVLLSSQSEVLNTLFNDCKASGGVVQLDALPHCDPLVVRRMLECLYVAAGTGKQR